jgi:hypothetical protein
MSRTMHSPIRTIFIGHFSNQRAVGARIERASNRMQKWVSSMTPRNQA